MSPFISSRRARQRGVALVVVMLLLIVVSLLGLSAMRGTLMQERMAASLYDRNLALQAAEAALREAEALVALPATAGAFPIVAGCVNGLCTTPVAGAIDRWKDATFTGWRTAAGEMDAVAGGAPRYIVEHLGDAPNWPGCDRETPVHPRCLSGRYRITARNPVLVDRAEVILQSTVSTP
jgi:type IV pilus assembly protein PilX